MYIVHLKPDLPVAKTEINDDERDHKTGFNLVQWQLVTFWIVLGSHTSDLNEIVKEKTKEDLNVQFVGLVGEKWDRDASQCFQKQKKYFRL